MRPTSISVGTLFLVATFVLAPAEAVALNEALDWPRWQIPGCRGVGAGLMVAGIAVVLYCSGLFSRIGRGSPVPIEPPAHLVIAGLYRFSRNPMYVAYVVFLVGLFLYRGEASLLLYAGIYAGGVHAWVVRLEEPGLRRRFGDEYVRYTEQVPRWILPRARGVRR
jgi:protein-S-isoprenylcysteine O-methyltransferase Ste14